MNPTTMTVDEELLTDAQFQDWMRIHTAGQAACWMKYSQVYGYESVNEWGNDPF